MHYTPSPVVEGIIVNTFGSGVIDGPTFIGHCSPENWPHKWDQLFVARATLRDMLLYRHIPNTRGIEQDIIFLDYLKDTVMALGTAARERQDAQTWIAKRRTAA